MKINALRIDIYEKVLLQPRSKKVKVIPKIAIQ